ncbi:MAG: hypothetical protein JWM56_299 [Candidatus Peribacteria bacterium]|nr:hypothetical protein [Candidatus Peribacteria bacterium]
MNSLAPGLQELFLLCYCHDVADPDYIAIGVGIECTVHSECGMITGWPQRSILAEPPQWFGAGDS